MAQRLKTVEYAFPQSTASVATAVARTFTAKTVSIPENTSRTIRSATIVYGCVDNVGVAASMTAVALSIQVDAVAVSTATVTMTPVNSGENQSWEWRKDVTAYFVTNFTGTSHSITAAMTVTGVATQNAYAKLILTYEYSDTAQTTRIKTVKIPIDGNIGALTTTFANLGGVANQIPNLSTFLPEATKVYRSIFFEWTTHTGTTVAAASTLDISYDGGTTTVSDLTWGHTLNSDTFYRRIDDLTASLSTSAAGNLQAKATSATGKPCPCLSGVLVVTYEYDHSTTTSVLNSIQLPLDSEPALNGGIATGDKSRFHREFYIEEPGTPVLVQSAIAITAICSGAITMDVRSGGQATRTYTHAASAHCGGMQHMRRIDAGESGAVAAFTIARGVNAFDVDSFSTSATAGNIASAVSGIAYINYTSNLHASGDGVHNHTVQYCIRPYATGGLVQRLQVVPAQVPIIPEVDHWLNGIGLDIITLTSGTTASTLGYSCLLERQTGEGSQAGWKAVYTGLFESDAEVGIMQSYGATLDEFLRWPQDTSGGCNLETARDYRFDCGLTAAIIFQMSMFFTYHAITFAIGGAITTSAGGTVTIDAHRISDGAEVGGTSRVGDGAYSIVWYDNVGQVYTEAFEDGTHIGRSANGVAV